MLLENNTEKKNQDKLSAVFEKKCSVINQMESLRKGNTFTKMFSPLTIFKTHYNHHFFGYLLTY